MNPLFTQTTLPDNLCISISVSSKDKERIHQLGELLMKVLRELGRYIDLSTLDGVTVSSDYDHALQTLDCGFTHSKPLTRSNSETRVGVAMAVYVKRDNVFKSHIVKHDFLLYSLESEEYNKKIESLYTITHECCHVNINGIFDKIFPGYMTQYKYKNGRESTFFPFAKDIWEEYSACVFSAFIGKDIITEMLEELVKSSMDGARKRVIKNIYEYGFIHGNLQLLMCNLKENIWMPIQCVARLKGHFDGLGVNTNLLDFISEFDDKKMFTPYIERMNACLDEMMEKFPDEWSDLSVFDTLINIGDGMLSEFGVHTTLGEDGQLFIKVVNPF